MPRFTAKRRLEIMGRALAIAEDRGDAVPLDELAQMLGIDRKRLDEALEPLAWLEFRSGSDSIISRLDDIELNEAELSVNRGWWRQITNLSPMEATRLYVQAAAAADLDPEHSVHLRSAMAKLRRIVGSLAVVSGERPHIVDQLLEARAEQRSVVLDLEGTRRTVATRSADFAVLSAFRHDADWMVTLVSVEGNSNLDLAPGGAITVPVSKIVASVPGEEIEVGALEDLAPSIVVAEPATEVLIEYPLTSDWVLDPFPVTDQQDLPGGTRRCRVRVWGIPELRTLLLRLGSDVRVVEPDEYADLAAATAAEILRLYEP